MDKSLILEFDTEHQAQICLAVINQLAAAYWVEQGYTVIETPEGNALVGKNALTGEDMPDSAKTITWDVVKVSPTNKYYIVDPAIRPEFSLWQERAEKAGYVFDGIKKEVAVS
jgi:hypothetical protein